MPLFTGFYVPEQSVWLACALFYLADCVKLISPQRQIVLRRTGRWQLLLPVFSNQPPHRTLAVIDPLTPWAPAVQVKLLAVDDPSPRDDRPDLHLYQLISVLMFVGLFAIGPSMTLARGLPSALLVLAPIHLGCLVLLAYALWREPSHAALPAMSRLGLWLECAVVPGYFVNVVRKRSLLTPPSTSALALLAVDGVRLEPREVQRLRDYASDLQESGQVEADYAAAFNQHLDRLMLEDASETAPRAS